VFGCLKLSSLYLSKNCNLFRQIYNFYRYYNNYLFVFLKLSMPFLIYIFSFYSIEYLITCYIMKPCSITYILIIRVQVHTYLLLYFSLSFFFKFSFTFHFPYMYVQFTKYIDLILLSVCLVTLATIGLFKLCQVVVILSFYHDFRSSLICLSLIFFGYRKLLMISMQHICGRWHNDLYYIICLASYSWHLTK